MAESDPSTRPRCEVVSISRHPEHATFNADKFVSLFDRCAQEVKANDGDVALFKTFISFLEKERRVFPERWHELLRLHS